MPHVLILGANGKIGAHSSAAFRKAGWTVTHYRRGTDMTAAARGADVIVNGLNPPNYHAWDRLIPQITAEVIAAARASGATVIVPGNVYVFGNQPGTLSEASPHTPCSRKGQVRAKMEEAYRDSGVQTLILRAGNFIDPDRNGDLMALVYLKDIARGRLTALGDPSAMQAYAYLPDWARAAEMLAERRAELARFEDIPFPGHSFSMVQLQAHLAAVLGRSLRMRRFPWILFRVTAPVWELAREMLEMRYLYSMPHTLSGDRFARLLPEFEPSSLAEAMEAGLPPQVRPDQPVRTGGKTVLS